MRALESSGVLHPGGRAGGSWSCQYQLIVLSCVARKHEHPPGTRNPFYFPARKEKISTTSPTCSAARASRFHGLAHRSHLPQGRAVVDCARIHLHVVVNWAKSALPDHL